MPRLHHRTAAAPRRGEAGFTWSEFTLVMVFVVGLIIVATTAVGGIRGDTRDSNCRTALRTLKLATESYYSAHDAYPVNKNVLVDDRLVKAGDVEGYDVAFQAGEARPTFTPSGDCG